MNQIVKWNLLGVCMPKHFNNSVTRGLRSVDVAWLILLGVIVVQSAHARDVEPRFTYQMPTCAGDPDTCAAVESPRYETPDAAYQALKDDVAASYVKYPNNIRTYFFDLFPAPQQQGVDPYINGLVSQYWWHYNRSDDPTIRSTGSVFIEYECPKSFILTITTLSTYVEKFSCVEQTAKPEPDPNCCKGNPVYPSTGVKRQTEVDYRSASSALKFARTYRSDRNGWVHNYQSYATGFDNVLGIQGPLSVDCLPAIGQTTNSPYCFRYISTVQNEVVVHRSDGRLLSFNGISGASNTTDVSDHITKITDANGNVTGFSVYVASDDVTEVYDQAGRLTSVTSRTGQTQSLTYSDGSTPTNIAPKVGLLIRVVDQSTGQQLSLTYDSQSRLKTITDPSGGVYNYAYDEATSIVLSGQSPAGNLTSVTYPDQSKKSYWYNEQDKTASTNLPFALTGITDENGVRYATWTYSTTGLALSSEHAGGVEKVTFVYNNDGTTTVNEFKNDTITPAVTRAYAFQAVQGVKKNTSISQPAASGVGTVTQGISYDTNGNVSSRTDFNGNVTNYTYDLTRNLETSRTEAYNTAQARTITTTWHATLRLPLSISVYNGGTATGTPIKTTTFTYDTSGNQLTKTITDPVNNISRTSTYTYNSYGQVLTIDGPRTDVSDITTYTYYTCNTGYQCGQVNTITNAAGQTITFNTYDVNGQPLTITDANGVVITLTYDARQRMTSRTVGTEVTSFDYWPTGLLKKVTLPDSSYLLYTYDNAHRLTQIQDAQGNKVVYTLDLADNHTAENLYDPSNALTRTHSQVFNSLNQLYQDINAANTAAVTTTFGYDSNGNQTTIAAPLTRNSSSQYDALNRLKQSTDPNNGVTQYAYDANDNLTTVIDPRNLTTSYNFNGLGDLTSQVSPDTNTTTNTYDSAGNLKTSIDANNATVVYSYDALNRITQATYPDQTITYTYDQNTNGKGHLTTVTDASGTTSLTYTAQGRINSKTQTTGSITKSIIYAYNNAGQLQQLTTPSGQNITYTYSNGKLATLSVNNAPLISSIAYDPFGPIKQWIWGNGTSSTRSYDQDGYLTTNTSAGSSTYTYNPDGSIATRNDDTVVSLNITTGSQSFTNASTSNKLNSISGTLTRTYTYDNDGHTLSDGTRSFTYNAAGRLVTATNASLTTTYTYNALGQRVKKSNTNGTTYFVYDEAGHELGEYDASGNLIQELVWLGDIPVATIRTDQSGGSVGVFYIHTDHLNAPTKITRPSDNQIIWRWDHDPYGNGTPNQDPDGNGLQLTFNLRFPGQYYDAETGLYYNYYRYFDPQTGKYITSDPIGLDGGLNTYAYVNGNPIRYIDPYGLQFIETEPAPRPTPRVPENVEEHNRWNEPNRQFQREFGNPDPETAPLSQVFPGRPKPYCYQVCDNDSNMCHAPPKNGVSDILHPGCYVVCSKGPFMSSPENEMPPSSAQPPRPPRHASWGDWWRAFRMWLRG